MNLAEEFHKKVLEALVYYTPYKVEKFFADLHSGDEADWNYWCEVYRSREYPCWFYQYVACATRLYQWKQAVEIGADRGASALMVASEMPDGKVYSIDSGKQGGEWKYVPEDVTNIVKIKMDSLEIDKLLATGVDLSKTDFWFIDGDHAPNRVRQECALYSPYWKKGAVVIFDDLTAVQPAFDELPYKHKFIDDGNLHGLPGVGSGILVV